MSQPSSDEASDELSDEQLSNAVRVGAIDCGTNSIRLLVADLDPATGALTDLVRRMQIVRLGHGVDRTGAIAPEAMERTLVATREYAAQCRELGATTVRFVATSASRDARNAAEFIAGVQAAFDEHWVSRSRPRSCRVTRRRPCRSAVPRVTWSLPAFRAPTSWSTSAVDRRSSSAAPPPSRPHARSTSAVSGSPSGTS